MSNTSILSEHIAGLKYEQLPEKTVWKVKRLILHVLAAALASADTPQARAATCIAARKESAGKAVVWGSKGLLASAEDAAFANATMADILDWEDCSWTGHPSAGVVPVALALGQALCKSGKRSSKQSWLDMTPTKESPCLCSLRPRNGGFRAMHGA